MGFLQRHGKAVASIEASVSQFGGTGLNRIGPPSWSYFACSKCGRRAKKLWLVDEARTGHYGSNFKQTGRAGPRSSQSVDDPPPRMLTEQVQRVQRSLPTANGPCWLTPARMLRDHSKTRLRVAVRPSPPIEARRSTNPSGKRTPQLRSATSCLSAMRALDRMLRISTEVRYVAGIARCVRSILPSER
jgi:hypothetical protein